MKSEATKSRNHNWRWTTQH